MINRNKLIKFIDAAQGKISCDLLIKDVRFLDVFSCQWCRGDVAVIDGFIVGLESGLKARRTMKGQGKTVVPGFIDAHVHMESSLLLPKNYQQAVLPRGTTSVISDPHEIANVRGVKGIRFFLKESLTMALDTWIMLSSCVPGTRLETNGAGHISAKDLVPFKSHPRVIGLAEVMNYPGVLSRENSVLAKLLAFSDSVVDGHCPLLRGHALSAYAASGISSCHESTSREEAGEKLLKGMSVWIREGSVAKDLRALIPLLSLATSTSMGFCTDDRNPWDIAEEGHIDYLVREAIRSGVPSEVAFRSASWSVARHYGLQRTGAVAPGYVANLILLDDERSVSVSDVFSHGNLVSEMDWPKAIPGSKVNSVRANVPETRDLLGPVGKVHVIGVEPGKIITQRHVLGYDAPGVHRLSVLERHGHKRKPANAYVSGFGEKLDGAIGSSVGHDSHNLIVVGTNVEDMRLGFAHLIELKGGFCVIQYGKVIADLALPYAGLMSFKGYREILACLKKLRQASRFIGCELAEPFLQLAFLSLPVIPSLKLTDRGLVDVDAFKIIDVRAA